MKNYKKIFKRFRKEIEKLVEEEERENGACTSREKLIRQIEREYAQATFDIILQIADELEGTEHHMQIMNVNQFNGWKRKIKT